MKSLKPAITSIANIKSIANITSITIFTILTFVSPITYAETKINRLFTSPDLRAQIDKYRKNPDLFKPKQIITRGTEAEKEAEKEIPTEKNIILKGLITKPDGSKVAWINDLKSNQIVKQHKGIANDTVLIQIGGDKSIPLKVGQIYQVEQNTVNEIFNQDEAEPEDEKRTKTEDTTQQSIKKEQDKRKNNEQSVEAPNKIIKTLIDIVNAKKAANQIIQNRIVEP